MCKRLKSMLSYQTVKMVKIEDVCLGSIHYALTVAIFIYIVVVQIVYKNGYVQFENPTGSVRMSLQAPVVDLCDPTKPHCSYNFTPAADLDYCSQAHSSDSNLDASKVLTCRDLDSFNTVWPVTGGTPFFIATRVQEANQTLVCQVPNVGTDTSCKQTYAFGCAGGFTVDPDCKEFAQDSYFVADIEGFTMLLDHTVQSPTVPTLKGDAQTMTGVLKTCTGETITPNKTPQNQDVFTVGQLLQAAAQEGTKCGVDLQGPSTVEASRTKRYDGLVLQLTITYQNVYHWRGPEKKIAYEYSVELIPGSKSKVLQQIFVHYPDQRVVRNIHGIKINVVQAGQLGTFSFTTLLLQLTTSLTLLKITTTIVDILAVRVLPNRAQYRRAKVLEVEVHDDGEVVARDRRHTLYGSLNNKRSTSSVVGAGVVETPATSLLKTASRSSNSNPPAANGAAH